LIKEDSLIGSEISVIVKNGEVYPKEIRERCDCNTIVTLKNKDNLTLWVGTCPKCYKEISVGDKTNI